MSIMPYLSRRAPSFPPLCLSIGRRVAAFAVAGVVGVAGAFVVPGVAHAERLKELNPKSIKFVCLLTCPEGIAALHRAHPDVPIYTAAIDRQLNEHGYILPGLGDAGDRIFGTK